LSESASTTVPVHTRTDAIKTEATGFLICVISD